MKKTTQKIKKYSYKWYAKQIGLPLGKKKKTVHVDTGSKIENTNYQISDQKLNGLIEQNNIKQKIGGFFIEKIELKNEYEKSLMLKIHVDAYDVEKDLGFIIFYPKKGVHFYNCKNYINLDNKPILEELN